MSRQNDNNTTILDPFKMAPCVCRLLPYSLCFAQKKKSRKYIINPKCDDTFNIFAQFFVVASPYASINDITVRY